MPRRVADIIEGKFQPAYLAQLVSSQLDVDRMDYLLRDSLMTGAKYGYYDLEWVVNAIEVDESADRIYVSARGLYAVEEYLQARYYMFRQVYFHRTLRSAEAVLRSVLRRALELTAGARSTARRARLREVLRPASAGARRLHGARRLRRSLPIISGRLRDPVLSDLCRRFTAAACSRPSPRHARAERPDFLDAARERTRQRGFAPEYYFIEDHAGDVPYYSYYDAGGAEPKARIYVEDGYARPVMREITEVSDAVRGLRSYQLHRVCFPPEVKDEVYALYHGEHTALSGQLSAKARPLSVVSCPLFCVGRIAADIEKVQSGRREPLTTDHGPKADS